MTEAFGRRIDAVMSIFRLLSDDSQRILEDQAELECELVFDEEATEIDPMTDTIRRGFFKLSCVKSLIEYYAGNDRNLLESEHQRRLITQTYEDYLLMIDNSEFPPAEIVL
jgi:hypothetical protein